MFKSFLTVTYYLFQVNLQFIQADRFLVADIRVDVARHLLFATREQMNQLNKCKRWFLDGTFKIVKPQGLEVRIFY